MTKHLPVGKLVKVITQSGREVTATQSKSFLVWNGEKFDAVNGSDVKVGDFLPTTHTLPKPEKQLDLFDLETIFHKNEYLYTDEIHKILKYKKEGRKYFSKKSFKEHNGKEYTVPYNRWDTLMGKRKDYLLNCKPGLVYIHNSNAFVSHVPSKIPLDKDFGFLMGLYIAEGLTTKTYMCISNNDEKIRKRITDYFDRFGITYHLVVKEGKRKCGDIEFYGKSSDLKIHSVLFARMFKLICDTGSANKRVPEFAYNANDDFIKGFIDGYFSGDGCVCKTQGSVSVSSVSKQLIEGVSFLLSYFGIFGRISCSKRKKNNIGSSNIKPLYNLVIRNGFAQKFANTFTLTEDRKQEKLQNITLKKDYRYELGISQEKFPLRDVYFDKVVSVEFVEGSTEYVYDLTVEETRNFSLFNGLNMRDKGVSNREH